MVRVGQQGEWQGLLLAEPGERRGVVGGDAHHRQAGEGGQAVAEVTCLRRASGGEGRRVGVEQHPPTPQVAQPDPRAVRVEEGEVGRRIAGSQSHARMLAGGASGE